MCSRLFLSLRGAFQQLRRPKITFKPLSSQSSFSTYVDSEESLSCCFCDYCEEEEEQCNGVPAFDTDSASMGSSDQSSVYHSVADSQSVSEPNVECVRAEERSLIDRDIADYDLLIDDVPAENQTKELTSAEYRAGETTCVEDLRTETDSTVAANDAGLDDENGGASQTEYLPSGAEITAATAFIHERLDFEVGWGGALLSSDDLKALVGVKDDASLDSGANESEVESVDGAWSSLCRTDLRYPDFLALI
jgi:hypothetical protein